MSQNINPNIKKRIHKKTFSINIQQSTLPYKNRSRVYSQPHPSLLKVQPIPKSLFNDNFNKNISFQSKAEVGITFQNNYSQSFKSRVLSARYKKQNQKSYSNDLNYVSNVKSIMLSKNSKQFRKKFVSYHYQKDFNDKNINNKKSSLREQIQSNKHYKINSIKKQKNTILFLSQQNLDCRNLQFKQSLILNKYDSLQNNKHKQINDQMNCSIVQNQFQQYNSLKIDNCDYFPMKQIKSKTINRPKVRKRIGLSKHKTINYQEIFDKDEKLILQDKKNQINQQNQHEQSNILQIQDFKNNSNEGLHSKQLLFTFGFNQIIN